LKWNLENIQMSELNTYLNIYSRFV
jgi:hypothetical protein